MSFLGLNRFLNSSLIFILDHSFSLKDRPWVYFQSTAILTLAFKIFYSIINDDFYLFECKQNKILKLLLNGFDFFLLLRINFYKCKQFFLSFSINFRKKYMRKMLLIYAGEQLKDGLFLVFTNHKAFRRKPHIIYLLFSLVFKALDKTI